MLNKEKKFNIESYRIRDIRMELENLYGERYVTYREKWNRSIYSEPYPLHLDIDLKDACNQNCAMCHQAYRKRTGETISKEILEKTICQASQVGLSSVNIGASCEPLLEKGLLLFALDICNKNNIIDTFIHTNGLLLDKDISKQLVGLGLKHLCVSVDAATDLIYKKIRKSSMLAKVEQNILNFLETRGSSTFPELRVSFCVTPLNISEKNDFRDKWLPIADLVEFQDYCNVVNAIPANDCFESKQLKTCAEGTKRGMLWPNAEISACCATQLGTSFGSMIGNSFEDVWGSRKAKEVRSALQNGGDGLPAFCKKCLAEFMQQSESCLF